MKKLNIIELDRKINRDKFLLDNIIKIICIILNLFKIIDFSNFTYKQLSKYNIEDIDIKNRKLYFRKKCF
jgi:hypothetical protein